MSISLAASRSKSLVTELRARSYGIFQKNKNDEEEIDPSLSVLLASAERSRALFVQQTQAIERVDNLYLRLDELVRNVLVDKHNNDVTASEMAKRDEQHCLQQALYFSTLSALEAEAESLLSTASTVIYYESRVCELQSLFRFARILMYMSTTLERKCPHVAFQLASESIIDLFETITREEEEEEEKEDDESQWLIKEKKVEEEVRRRRKESTTKSLDSNYPSFSLPPSPFRLLRLGLLHALFWIIRGRAVASFALSTCVSESQDACILDCERHIDKSISLLSSLIETAIESEVIKTTGDGVLKNNVEGGGKATLSMITPEKALISPHNVISGDQAVDYHLDGSSYQKLLAETCHNSSSLFSCAALRHDWDLVFKVVSIPEPITKSQASNFIRILSTNVKSLREYLAMDSKMTIMQAILNSDRCYPPLTPDVKLHISSASSFNTLRSAACGSLLFTEGFCRAGTLLLSNSGDLESTTPLLKKSHVVLILLCRTMAFVSTGIDTEFKKAIQTSTTGVNLLLNMFSVDDHHGVVKDSRRCVNPCQRFDSLCLRFYILRAVSICYVLDRKRSEKREGGTSSEVDDDDDDEKILNHYSSYDDLRLMAISDSNKAGILLKSARQSHNNAQLHSSQCSCESKSLEKDHHCIFSNSHRRCCENSEEHEEDLIIAEHILLDVSLNRNMSSQRALARIIGESDEAAVAQVKSRVASLIIH